MNNDLKSFAWSVLGAIIVPLLIVAGAAFISIPLSLGHHPGDSPDPATVLVRHLT